MGYMNNAFKYFVSAEKNAEYNTIKEEFEQQIKTLHHTLSSIDILYHKIVEKQKSRDARSMLDTFTSNVLCAQLNDIQVIVNLKNFLCVMCKNFLVLENNLIVCSAKIDRVLRDELYITRSRAVISTEV